MAEIIVSNNQVIAKVLVPGTQGPPGPAGVGDISGLTAQVETNRNRSRHLGVQHASTIDDLTSVVQGIIDAHLVAGTAVTLTHNTNGDLVITSTATGGGTLDGNAVKDIVGAMMRAGTGITVSYDAANHLESITAALATVAGRTGDVVIGTGDVANLVEYIEDTVAAMIARGSSTGVTVTYADNGASLGSLSFTTTTGATGPQGPAGPAGPAGVAGPAGALGPAGPAGPVGGPGPSGPAGADGQIGAPGQAGQDAASMVVTLVGQLPPPGTPSGTFWQQYYQQQTAAGVASTDVFTAAAHGLTTGDPIGLVNDGPAPLLSANLVASPNPTGPFYYAIVLSTSTFKLATTFANATAGTPVPVDITADGTLTFTR